MAWAEAGAAIFGTCARRNYMALVLSPTGRILGTGYNGTPPGFLHCDQGGCPRASTDCDPGSSYSNCLAIHAEANALLHSDRGDREGGTLIINGPPCWECARLISGSGIKTVVYKQDAAYKDWARIRMFLSRAEIELVEIRGSGASVRYIDDESFVDGPPGDDVEVEVALRNRVGTSLATSHILGLPMGAPASVHFNDGRQDLECGDQ